MPEIKTYYIDTEVYSPHDFRAGLKHYFTDAEVLLIQYAVDDCEPVVQLASDIKSKDQLPFFQTPCRWVIHNADFDVMALSHHLGFDCYDLPGVEVLDTSIIARQHRLPVALADLAKLLGTNSQKLAGTLLINRFCKPNKKGTIYPRSGKHWDDFLEYAKADVTTLRDIYRIVGNWEYKKHKPTELMNRNGIPIDQERSKESWAKTCDIRAKIKEQLPDITRTAVYLKYLQDNGVQVSNLKKQTLLDWIDANPEHPSVELVEMRLSAGKSVLNKYEIMSQTNLVSHSYLFFGASATGRWSAKGLQPQNLPRPAPIGDDLIGLSRDIAELKNNLREHITIDKLLTIADLKQIEPRLQAWLIGDTDKIGRAHV